MPIRFQVDPDFYDHPKTAGMSDAAFSLWVRAGSFSAAKLTDGFIAEAVLVHTLRSDTTVADELVDRGLWRRRRGGYVFHEWQERNLTRQRVQDHNQAEAKRKRASRAAAKNLNDQLINNVSSNAAGKVNPEDQHVKGHNVRPDTTRTPAGHSPESKSVGVGVGVGVKELDGYVDLSAQENQHARAQRDHELPDDWAPHDGHRMLAARHGLNLNHETHQFRAHALDKARTSANWNSAFDSWLGKAGVAYGPRLRVVNGTNDIHRDPKTGRAVEW